MAGAAKTSQRHRLKGFYRKSLTEAEKWERARQMEGLDEEIALLRVMLKEALEERPQDMQLIAKGVDLLVKAVAAKYRLSPKAQRVFGVSESDILCKQFLTDRCGLVLAPRQRYVRPQQGASDDRTEVPGGAGGRGQQ